MMLNFNQKPLTTSQLKAKIVKLEQDKEKFRLLAHELIESFYKVVNQTENKENFCPKCGCQEVNHE